MDPVSPTRTRMEKRPQIVRTAQTRVRFAPSPTGHLHVGGARTALFNYLFARKSGGTFVLRIEDSDAERSSDESTRGILDSLRWLGLHWDEGPDVGGPFGPYQQTLRHVVYRAEAERLIAEDHAYPCFCSREEVDSMRERAAKTGNAVRYDGRCGRLDAAERDRLTNAGRTSVVRFRMPRGGKITWVDLARGELTFDLDQLDDFVLIKSDGNPTYNFAAVVDDAKMRISHVIRGDDHISNTPKQLVLYEALGFPVPEFAHLPMIVGPDKSRLSKRHGATSVTAFGDAGILSRAMVNYLALLGWSYDGKREIFSLDELVQFFDLKQVGRAAAVFDLQKLHWMNGEHIAQLTLGDKVRALVPQMRAQGLWPPKFRVELTPGPHLRVVTGRRDDKIAGSIQPLTEDEWMRQEPSLADELPRLKLILETVGNRLVGPHAVTPILGYFYSDDIAFDTAGVEKHLSGDDTAELLRALADVIDAVKPYTPETIETALRGLAAARELKAANIIHPARVALTGATVSPGIFDVLYLLGRPKSAARLRTGADIVEQNRRFGQGSAGSEPDPSKAP